MATRAGRQMLAQSLKEVQRKLAQNNEPKRVGGMSRVFVDSMWVKFLGGPGGDGAIAMMSLFANEFAGPSGGNGGNGGHVVLRASADIKSLNKVAKVYRGLPGTRGQGKNMYGADAAHTFVEVPIGTLVLPAKPMALRRYDPQGAAGQESEIIADLDAEGSMFIAARGGAGGRGNAAFLSNKNRHPRIAEVGAKGEENTYELRLKTYAHVGLIGLPNAGKSSLLRTLTGARVKIGNYAFTTLHPQVGTIEFDDFSQVAISDLPGLIEDSHKNRGMGMQFLRSLQRCACLLYVIDLGADEPAPTPVEQFERLASELDSHRPGMSRRPHAVFANKLDAPRAPERAAQLAAYLARERPGATLIVGSCSRGDGLLELRHELKRLHDEYQAQNADELDQALRW